MAIRGRQLLMGCYCILCLLARAHANDPLDSPSWEGLQKTYFADQKVVFDERVKVLTPLTAENPMRVPVSVDASTLPQVQEIRVLADLNPIVEILSFIPDHAEASLSFQTKLQQSSPIRAAARTPDGVWHVGGSWVKTTGGGCALPSVGSANKDWQAHLNEVSGRIWNGDSASSGSRLRLRVTHPMDTGLAPGIPAFFIQKLEIRDDAGLLLMRIHPREPVSENPLFTLDFPVSQGKLLRALVSGEDNNGNRINAAVGP